MTPSKLQDIFEWDVVNWSRSLNLWEPQLANKLSGEALTLGERGGGLSLYLAEKGFKVTCTDLREFPESTRQLHEKYQVQDLIDYRNEDMTKLSFGDNSFDAVMFKSVIGALSTKENQQIAVNEIYRVLKPGGVLLFAENARASKLHQFARKKFIKWNTYWRYLDYRNDLDLFQNYNKLSLSSYGFFGAFGRNEGQRKVLGKCDTIAQKLVLKSMRYIVVGAYKKRI